ncbi:MAG: S-layer homology domain-containing protein [Clostridiales bacterium]|nr:S-layer homology domain-containing protein [Clostridiales bacterium]
MKKFIGIILSAALALSSISMSASALEYGSEWSGYTNDAKSAFSDVPSDHWASDNISRAVAKGWFDGYPDGSFHPNASIRRCEAMTVFVKFLGLSTNPNAQSSYADVKGDNAWAIPYIEAGKKLFPPREAFNGEVPFLPDQPITREDTVYALVIALKYNDKVPGADQSVLNMFKDQNSISALIKPYMAVAVKYGLVSGYDDGTIGAQDPLTRAEFATLLSRASTIGFGTGGGLADVAEPEVTAEPTAEPTTAPTTNPEPVNSAQISGRVVNSSNAPMQGVSVKLSDGATAVTDENGQYTVSTSRTSVTITASYEGYVDAQITMQVTPGIVNYAETIKLVTAAQGTVSGKVYDALVQNGTIEGAKISFRANGNTTSGDVVAETVSGADGSFSVSLPTGTYTAEGKKDGYSTAYVTVVSQENAAQQDITLVPVMEGTAFILTWGETPADIDSHLTGPLSDGNRFHVFYRAMNASDGGTAAANLDRDDVTSYGPETVTILNQIDGVYRYTVHDYTNRHSSDCSELSKSGAKVVVYVDGEYKNTFNVPVNQGGTIWTVFELNGNTITPINTMSYQSDPTAVGASGSTHSDAALISETTKEDK